MEDDDRSKRDTAEEGISRRALLAGAASVSLVAMIASIRGCFSDVSEKGPQREQNPVENATMRDVLNIGGREHEIPGVLQRIEQAKNYLNTVEPIQVGRDMVFLDSENWGNNDLFYVTEQTDGVRLVQRNGRNSQYSYRNDRRNVLVALRSDGNFVYVPYSPALDTPDVRAAGGEYIARVIDLAKEELRGGNVTSHVYGRRCVADVFSDELVEQLLIIEHVDPDQFQAARGSESDLKDLFNRVLVIAGGNREMSYGTGNYAGAFGFAQFIPTTYQMVKDAYPAAGLKENFREGMLDHVNAVKAMYCLMDNDLGRMDDPERLASLNLAHNEDELADYLAASYNGGAGRANRRFRAFGADWKQHLPSETTVYLEKLRYLRDLQRNN